MNETDEDSETQQLAAHVTFYPDHITAISLAIEILLLHLANAPKPAAPLDRLRYRDRRELLHDLQVIEEVMHDISDDLATHENHAQH